MIVDERKWVITPLFEDIFVWSYAAKPHQFSRYIWFTYRRQTRRMKRPNKRVNRGLRLRWTAALWSFMLEEVLQWEQRQPPKLQLVNIHCNFQQRNDFAEKITHHHQNLMNHKSHFRNHAQSIWQSFRNWNVTFTIGLLSAYTV